MAGGSTNEMQGKSVCLGAILEGLPLLLFFYTETLCPRFLRDGGHLWLAAPAPTYRLESQCPSLSLSSPSSKALAPALRVTSHQALHSGHCKQSLHSPVLEQLKRPGSPKC